MPMRRRTFRTRSAPRRKRQWARERNVITLSDGSSLFAADLLSNFVSANGDPHGATIMNVKLQFWAQFIDTATSSATDHNLWIGVIKGDYETSGEVPVPIIAGDPQHRDWMWFEQVKPQLSAAAATSLSQYAVVSNMSGWGTEESPFRDIKARRRLDELGESLWLVAQRETADTGLSIDFQFSTSTLLLLP